MASTYQINRYIFEKYDRYHPPVRLSELVVEAICHVSDLHISDAQELAEKRYSKVREKIGDYIEKRNYQNRSCSICFAVGSTDYIQGVDYIHSQDSIELAKRKEARAATKAIRSRIQKLNPDQFEDLMGAILRKIGVRDVFVTSASSDDGVDFFGRLRIGDFSPEVTLPDHFLNEVDVAIVGQAKRYASSKFKLADVRELVGSIHLIRSNVSARVRSQEKLNLKVAEPVINLFVISNSVSENGWRLAERSGVKILDAEKLSLLVADLGVVIPEPA